MDCRQASGKWLELEIVITLTEGRTSAPYLGPLPSQMTQSCAKNLPTLTQAVYSQYTDVVDYAYSLCVWA